MVAAVYELTFNRFKCDSEQPHPQLQEGVHTIHVQPHYSSYFFTSPFEGEKTPNNPKTKLFLFICVQQVIGHIESGQSFEIIYRGLFFI